MAPRSRIVLVVLIAALAAASAAVAVHVRDASRAAEIARRERDLRGALATIRSSLTRYHTRHGHNPATLIELVRDGELHAIPRDPVTGSATTWRVIVEEPVTVDDFQAVPSAASPTIVEVHSGAAGVDSSGRRFGEY